MLDFYYLCRQSEIYLFADSSVSFELSTYRKRCLASATYRACSESKMPVFFRSVLISSRLSSFTFAFLYIHSPRSLEFIYFLFSSCFMLLISLFFFFHFSISSCFFLYLHRIFSVYSLVYFYIYAN